MASRTAKIATPFLARNRSILRCVETTALGLILAVLTGCRSSQAGERNSGAPPFLMLDKATLTREEFLAEFTEDLDPSIADDSLEMTQLIHLRVETFIRRRLEPQHRSEVTDDQIQAWCDMQAGFMQLGPNGSERLATFEIARLTALKQVLSGESSVDNELDKLELLADSLGFENGEARASRAELVRLFTRDLDSVRSGRTDVERDLRVLRERGWAWWMFSANARAELTWKAIVEHEYGRIEPRPEAVEREYERAGFPDAFRSEQALRWKSLEGEVHARQCRLIREWLDNGRVRIGVAVAESRYRQYLSASADRG